jgi:cation:H+ antiporter
VVVVGSSLLVESAVALAQRLGIPTIVIGLSIVAVGTSLPELITAVTSSRRNVSDLAVGNVLGANVANLSLVVGTAAAVHEVEMSRQTQLFNFPVLAIMMLLLLTMILLQRGITRRDGFVLLTFYGVYLAALVGLTIGMRP